MLLFILEFTKIMQSQFSLIISDVSTKDVYYSNHTHCHKSLRYFDHANDLIRIEKSYRLNINNIYLIFHPY